MLVAWLVAKLGRRVLVRITRVLSRRTLWTWDDALVKRRVFGLALFQQPTGADLRKGLHTMPPAKPR